jgi:hypothetical protein
MGHTNIDMKDCAAKIAELDRSGSNPPVLKYGAFEDLMMPIA